MNSNLVLVGFLVMLICQDIVAMKALRKNTMKGILCAMVPGYILIYVSREDVRLHAKPLMGWLAGLGLLMMGFIR